MITDYRGRKLVEYLQPGGKYLIRFGHGLGDTLMFMPALQRLRMQHPECTIDVYLESGQEEIFNSAQDKEGEEYDEVFHLDYPMSEGGRNGTKTEKCCRDELGMDGKMLPDVAPLDEWESPLVAVHFQGTALPGSVNCPADVASQIWQEVVDADMIPIEVHFQHMFHNPVNEKYKFVSRHVRDCKASLPSLIGLMQRCRAFIGVASGPFVVALSVMERDRIMYLERRHGLENYVRHNMDIVRVDVNQGYEKGMVKSWLLQMD